MSLYYLQKFLYELNRDGAVKEKYHKDPDIGLLYVLGVNGQILMHFAALLGIEWFDYLKMMREGVEKYGPVRAGVYTMTGGGKSFAEEGEGK